MLPVVGEDNIPLTCPTLLALLPAPLDPLGGPRVALVLEHQTRGRPVRACVHTEQIDSNAPTTSRELLEHSVEE